MTPEERLADELYELIEADQGASYISDGIGNLSAREIRRIAIDAARAHERCARKLRKWWLEARLRESLMMETE